MNRLIIKSTLEKSSHDISECADEKTNNIFNILFNSLAGVKFEDLIVITAGLGSLFTNAIR